MANVHEILAKQVVFVNPASRDTVAGNPDFTPETVHQSADVVEISPIIQKRK